MRIGIIDNGKGADAIAKMLRTSNIIKASSISHKMPETKNLSGFILTDGDIKYKKQNVKLIRATSKPMLGIGAGYLFIANAFGAKIKASNVPKREQIKISKPCPLTLNLKRMFNVIKDCNHVLSDIPKNFGIVASSKKYKFEIIQDFTLPIFGVHFNPELGLDGNKIIKNFERFVILFEKYNR